MAVVYTLRKVSRLPINVFFARWRLKDGTEVEHALTEQEYRALAQKGAGAPPNRTGDAGAVWLHAYERWQFDTPSGWLEPGDLSDAWPDRWTFSLPEVRADRLVKLPRTAFTLDALDRLTFVGATLDTAYRDRYPALDRLSIVDGVATIADEPTVR